MGQMKCGSAPFPLSGRGFSINLKGDIQRKSVGYFFTHFVWQDFFGKFGTVVIIPTRNRASAQGFFAMHKSPISCHKSEKGMHLVS